MSGSVYNVDGQPYRNGRPMSALDISVYNSMKADANKSAKQQAKPLVPKTKPVPVAPKSKPTVSSRDARLLDAAKKSQELKAIQRSGLGAMLGFN